MANTIVDAGTDAKVAKFARRGLEIIGLAIFEPIEVWSSAPLPGILPTTGSTRTSFDDAHREFTLSPRPQTVNSRPSTADPSLVRNSPLNARRELFHKPSINLTPPDPAPTDAQSQRGAKKLFGRMFKKKDPPRPLSAAMPEAVDRASSLGSSLRAAATAARLSHEMPVAAKLQPETPPPGDGPLTSTNTALCPAVLGTQPALYPPITPPKGRPTKYIWVVRKWLKGTEAGLLNGMMGKLSVNGRSSVPALGTPQVEVRFEWSRGRQKNKGRKGREDRTVSASGTGAGGNEGHRGSVTLSNHSPSASIRQTSSQLPNLSTRDATAGNHRHSTVSQLSTSSGTATSLDSGHAQRTAEEESGDESDPEDSETPWACAITIRRLGPSPVPPMGDSGTQRENVMRLKVATLAPTPHHPKVVGLLKMPFPLPDIEVEHLAVRRRIVTAQGISKTTSNSGGLVLTAEEIKDVISSTALWLVVREAFGGVGRERRKGDGWRIRA